MRQHAKIWKAQAKARAELAADDPSGTPAGAAPGPPRYAPRLRPRARGGGRAERRRQLGPAVRDDVELPGLRDPRRDAAHRQGPDVGLSDPRGQAAFRGNESYAWLWDPAKGYGPDAVEDVTPVIDGKNVSIYCSGMSFLPDGRVLVVGGTLKWGDEIRTTRSRTSPGSTRRVIFDPDDRDVGRPPAARGLARALVPDPDAAPRRPHVRDQRVQRRARPGAS